MEPRTLSGSTTGFEEPRNASFHRSLPGNDAKTSNVTPDLHAKTSPDPAQDSPDRHQIFVDILRYYLVGLVVVFVVVTVVVVVAVVGVVVVVRSFHCRCVGGCSSCSCCCCCRWLCWRRKRKTENKQSLQRSQFPN